MQISYILPKYGLTKECLLLKIQLVHFRVICFKVIIVATCTFFGHRDIPQEIELTLRSTLINLIENKHVDLFYVGNQGNFDYMVLKNLTLLKLDYPHISYAVVLAYMPYKKNELNNKDYPNTIYPEGLENTPPKYAIIKRNRWMIDKADYVVTYVKDIVGGAIRFKEFSEKKGKIVLNLADFD